VSKAIPHYSADDNVLASGGLNTAPLLESVRPGTAFSNTLRLSMKAGRHPRPIRSGNGNIQPVVGRSEAARSLDGRPEAKTK